MATTHETIEDDEVESRIETRKLNSAPCYICTECSRLYTDRGDIEFHIKKDHLKI